MKKINASNKNARVITAGNRSILVSYETIVAMFDKDTGIAYKTTTKFSVTTSRHINIFLLEVSPATVQDVDQSFFDNLIPAIH